MSRVVYKRSILSTVSSSSVSVRRNAPDSPPFPPPPHALQQLAVQGAVCSSLQPQLPPHVLPMLYFSPPASRQAASAATLHAPRCCMVTAGPRPAIGSRAAAPARSLARARAEKAALSPIGCCGVRGLQPLARLARCSLLGDWASVNILVSFSVCFPAAPLPPARADRASPRTNELLRAAANWLPAPPLAPSLNELPAPLRYVDRRGR